MDRFHEMQVFLAVAEEQGFAAAARRLNTSPPSVTRAIAAMEQRLGTQLLARTTRSLHLTEAGQRYLADATTESGVTAWSCILVFQIRLQPIFQNDGSSLFLFEGHRSIKAVQVRDKTGR